MVSFSSIKCFAAFLIPLFLFAFMVMKPNKNLKKLVVNDLSSEVFPNLVFSGQALTRESADVAGDALDVAFEKERRTQFGEELFAYDHFFFRRREGIVLESGALDGTLISTTIALCRVLGWAAVHVEPGPVAFSKLSAGRPEALNVHAALCNTTGVLHFAESSQSPEASGIWEFMSAAHKDVWFPGLSDISHLPTISCWPLAQLLRKFGICHIDFWILDVEGSELDVLKSVDWTSIQIDVLCIEADGTNLMKEAAVQELLISKGYNYYGHVDINDWFARADFLPRVRPGKTLTPIRAFRRLP